MQKRKLSKLFWYTTCIFFVICSLLSIYIFFPNIKTKVFRSFAKGTFFITTDADTVYTLGFYGIRKYDATDPYNMKLIASNNEICKNFNIGRSMAIYKDYVYVISRSYWGGKQEEDVPKIRFRFEEPIIDHRNKNNTFDSIITSPNIQINNKGEKGTNFGIHSLKLMSMESISNMTTSKLIKKIKCSNKGCISFWLYVDSINSHCSIPLIGAKGKSPIEMIIKKHGNGKFIVNFKNIDCNIKCNQYFSNKDWYQFKVKIGRNKNKFFWRNKECSKWEEIHHDNKKTTLIDELQVGISTMYSGTTIFIDDYYYDTDDLDNCSYINGTLSIMRKNNLKILNTYYSDIKLIDSEIYKNTLVVSGLYGFNIYDLSNPIHPKLVYTYRHPTFKEFQGVEIFTSKGHTYAVFAMFAEGLSIWDITEPSKTRCIYTHYLSDKMSNGKVLKKGLQSFDIKIKYPYVYATIGPMKETQFTKNDTKGILVYDIHDMNNIDVTFTEIPRKYWYTRTTSDGQPTCIIISNQSLYINWGNKGVVRFDISNPQTPIFKEIINISGDKILSPMAISNKKFLFAGSTYWQRINTIKLYE